MPKHQLKTNSIYCGDNLEMLKEVPDESIDLIYIDPPFNSNRSYETFWHDTQEKRAFEDSFGDAKAYIDYMRPRIVELYRVLKKTGGFYYHCDWHAGHYVKIMLDEIFNFNNFQNEIIWSYHSGGASARRFGRKHDNIFWYTKSKEYTFNEEVARVPYTESTIAAYSKRDAEGVYKLIKHKDGSEEKVYAKNLERGRILTDVWEIPHIANWSSEKQGYPTQKPLVLLERIIAVGSNKGDVVLDAFCGCGTALIAAQKLGRKWIGIDISPTACRVMAQRLWNACRLTEGKDFELINKLRNEKQLREIPPFEFQNWAINAFGGIPNPIKVGDYGIDGRLYPIDRGKMKGDVKSLFGDTDTDYPIQVKQKDKAGRPDIDSFQTAIRRDKRRKGYFISFDFSEDAMKEIRRITKEGEIEIIPVTVKELLDKSGFEIEK
jgi:DNA modification methylase